MLSLSWNRNQTVMLSELRCLRSALGLRKLYSRHQTRILTYLGLPGRGSNPGLYITRETLQLQSWYGRFYQDKECPRWRSSCSMHAMLCSLIPDGQYKTLYTWKKAVYAAKQMRMQRQLYLRLLYWSPYTPGKKQCTRLNRCQCKGNFT